MFSKLFPQSPSKALAILALSISPIALGDEPVQKPNLVFILADDLGWADTTLYGHTTLYETPNIDRLAKLGMTFTHAYADSPLCSPTRSAILTGLSPARTGITAPNAHLPKVILEASPGKRAPAGKKSVSPQIVSRLDTSYYTMAEAFSDAGYATGHFGKWHLGHKPYSPLEHGFDIDLPHWPGPGPAGSFLAPWKFPDFDHDPQLPHEHIEDRMAKEARAFMKAHKDGPFFLNYWMFSVHAPFDAKDELIAKYRKKVEPEAAQRSAIYAAMIESMDDAVGTLLDTIEELGIAEHTIIVFYSDNGGNMYNEVEGTAPTSNAPLRGGKANVYEGGVRVPCIVRWPGITQSDSKSAAVIQGADFFPTFVESLPIAAEPDQEFDGISILPALSGQPLDREAIFSYYPHSPPIPEWLPPSVTVWRDDWKLIRLFHQGVSGAHRYKLYNLKEDLSEANNLAQTHPKKLDELDALIEEFLTDTKAVTPGRNPDFKLSAYQPELEGTASLRPSRERVPKGKVEAAD